MKNCRHAQHNICQVATRLANQPVPLNPQACNSCQLDLMPMAVNRVTAAIACHTQRKTRKPVDRDLLLIASGQYGLAGYRVERYIHKWLKRFGITPPEDCGCDSWVSRMNKWGVQGSLERLDEITDQLYISLKETYLAGIATAWLAKPLIKQRIRACLLKN